MSNQTRTGEVGGAKWTPEPWKAGTPYQHSDIANLLIPIVSDATADTVALVVGGEDDAATHADSARIVSCVNAMQGIDDPAALVRAARNALACLEDAKSDLSHRGFPSVVRDELRAALQSAKSLTQRGA